MSDDLGTPPALDGFRARIAGVGPQVGFLFPVGDYQGYLNIRGYKDVEVENRASTWTAWVTFAISPAPPETTSSKLMVRKY